MTTMKSCIHPPPPPPPPAWLLGGGIIPTPPAPPPPPPTIVALIRVTLFGTVNVAPGTLMVMELEKGTPVGPTGPVSPVTPVCPVAPVSPVKPKALLNNQVLLNASRYETRLMVVLFAKITEPKVQLIVSEPAAVMVVVDPEDGLSRRTKLNGIPEEVIAGRVIPTLPVDASTAKSANLVSST
jgi:hypothetical protein